MEYERNKTVAPAENRLFFMFHQAMPLSENFTPRIFYLPCLCRELVAGPLPEEVCFLNPGLMPPAGARRERVWTPAGLPYDPANAARCLQDLIAEGENADRNLLLAAGFGGDANVLAVSALPTFDSSENAALRAFEQTGNYEPQARAGGFQNLSAQAAREQAQKLLLLHFHLEENILAAGKLTQKISVGEAALRELLQGSGEPDGLENTDTRGAAPDRDALFGQYLARWVGIARAWRLFLPDDAVFYTADLSALGLDAPSRPLPPEEAACLFPASMAGGWTFVIAGPEELRNEVRLVSGRCPRTA